MDQFTKIKAKVNHCGAGYVNSLGIDTFLLLLIVSRFVKWIKSILSQRVTFGTIMEKLLSSRHIAFSSKGVRQCSLITFVMTFSIVNSDTRYHLSREGRMCVVHVKCSLAALN